MSRDNINNLCEQIRAMKFHFPLSRELEDQYYIYVDHISECKECSNWELSKRIIDRGKDPKDFCCPFLGNIVTDKCDQHPDPWDCPDHLIIKIAEGEYVIPIRDGGSSYIKIDYCPWCGAELK